MCGGVGGGEAVERGGGGGETERNGLAGLRRRRVGGRGWGGSGGRVAGGRKHLDGLLPL